MKRKQLMVKFKVSRSIAVVMLSVFLSAIVVYCIKEGYVAAIGDAKILLIVVGLVFVVLSVLGAVIVYRGYRKLVWQNRLAIFVALALLGFGGLTGLMTGMTPILLPREWSELGIYFAVINLGLMFLGIPLCGYIAWRAGRRRNKSGSK